GALPARPGRHHRLAGADRGRGAGGRRVRPRRHGDPVLRPAAGQGGGVGGGPGAGPGPAARRGGRVPGRGPAVQPAAADRAAGRPRVPGRRLRHRVDRPDAGVAKDAGVGEARATAWLDAPDGHTARRQRLRIAAADEHAAGAGAEWARSRAGLTRAGLRKERGMTEHRAEMVANVWKVVAHEGDDVKPGDTLVILESMKMEIPVISEVSGKVGKLPVHEGDVVQEGDMIAEVDSQGA